MTTAAKLYMDADADLAAIAGQTMAVVGYGTQGTARAMNMRDSGVNVIIGADKDSEHWRRALEDGFTVMPIEEAAREAQLFELEVPDLAYRLADTWKNKILPYHKPGDLICCSSAMVYYYQRLLPPEGIDAICCAAKAPGASVRTEFVRGSGVPGLLAIHQDATGKALERGLAMCKAMGFTRVGVQESTVEEETITDLLGEHCSWGAIVVLLKTVFEVMVEEGYDPDTAFYEAINESKLTTDLIYKFGMAGMLERISNTAAYGALLIGPKIIDERVKENIRVALYNIKNGGFDQAWHTDYKNNYADFNRRLEEIRNCPAEVVGNRIRERLRVREDGDFKVKNV